MSLLTVKRAFIVRVPTNCEPSKVICRVCRKQCSDRDQVALFKNSTLRTNATMLALIADVKIIPKDRLPTVICLTCNNILEKAYVLRTVAQNSDKLFRKLLMQKGLHPKEGVPNKKVLKQKSPNKDNIRGNSATKVKYEDNTEDMFNQEGSLTTEPLSTSQDDIFSDMNDTNDVKCSVKDIEDGFEDGGFLQDHDDSDPDYTPTKEEVEDVEEDEDGENKQSIVTPKKTPSFSSRVTVRPRANVVSRGGVKTKTKPLSTELRQFLWLNKQHALKQKQQKREAERRRIIQKARQAKAKSSEVPSLCSVCGIVAKNMNAHQRQHQEKTLKCTLCSKAYKVQSHLNAHMKKHLGQRDYKCELCDAAFYEKKGVVRHMLMHTQKRPYQCKICGKSFSYNNVLRNHMDIHLNRRPFSCDICERPFRTKKHLKTHMIIHTGEKPFSCEICDLQFSYKVNLNQHMAGSHAANWKYKSIPKVTQKILEEESAKDALKAILPYVQQAQHEITITTSETNEDMDVIQICLDQ